MASDAAYLSLKLAHELYRKSPDALEADERRRVAAVAARQFRIESRILATPNAALAVLPQASVDACVEEIRSRYPDEAEFAADLARAGLDADALRAAVVRELSIEAVLDQAAANAAPVSDTDVEIFYLQHGARFRRPEMRTLRHILVTIDESRAGSARGAARTKIEAVRERLLKDTRRFAEQALKHSECPTALNGGLLGKMPRGKLYAELEATAFALGPGELSDVVESPLGFHVLRCDAIHPDAQVPLAEVREKIRAHMTEVRRMALQKNWIAALLQS